MLCNSADVSIRLLKRQPRPNGSRISVERRHVRHVLRSQSQVSSRGLSRSLSHAAAAPAHWLHSLRGGSAVQPTSLCVCRHDGGTGVRAWTWRRRTVTRPIPPTTHRPLGWSAHRPGWKAGAPGVVAAPDVAAQHLAELLAPRLDAVGRVCIDAIARGVRHGLLWCHGTRYVRHARAWYAYGVRTVAAHRGKLPCASGTYSTQEAGTRSPYVQYGGSRMYV